MPSQPPLPKIQLPPNFTLNLTYPSLCFISTSVPSPISPRAAYLPQSLAPALLPKLLQGGRKGTSTPPPSRQVPTPHPPRGRLPRGSPRRGRPRPPHSGASEAATRSQRGRTLRRPDSLPEPSPRRTPHPAGGPGLRPPHPQLPRRPQHPGRGGHGGSGMGGGGRREPGEAGWARARPGDSPPGAAGSIADPRPLPGGGAEVADTWRHPHPLLRRR